MGVFSLIYMPSIKVLVPLKPIIVGGLSGVARAFPGGRTAHPEDQNEEEN